MRALQLRKSRGGREARAHGAQKGGVFRGDGLARPLARARGEKGAGGAARREEARRAGGGRGAGAREGLSTGRFWLKYSKWRTEEQRVKMRVRPRRPQQQVIITAFYIFIFILQPGCRGPPAT